MSDNAFDDATDPKQEESDSSASAPLNDLIGEGKKFKSVEDLAKAKMESDKHISKLEGENKDMRDELSKLATKVENLSSLSQPKQTDTESPADTTSPADEGKISELVAKTYHNIREKEARQDNLRQSNDYAVEKFGSVDKAREALKHRAEELNLSVEDLKEIGSKSPNAFKNMFEESSRDSSVNVKSSVNTEAGDYGQAPNSAKHGTKEYYTKLRRENPSQFWSAKVQREIMAKVNNGEITYKT